MAFNEVIGFGLAVTPLVLTPGASFTLVSARSVSGDRRGAWATIAGTGAGILTHAVLAGAGLAAVVMRSAELYHILRLVGAAYLVGLGLFMLVRGVRGTYSFSSGEPPTTGAGLVKRRVWQAYLANVLNVKAAAVYLTLAPQFTPAESIGVTSMVVLAIAHIVMMTLWLGLWALGLTSLTARVNPRRWLPWIDAIGGAALVFLGVRSARSTS